MLENKDDATVGKSIRGVRGRERRDAKQTRKGKIGFSSGRRVRSKGAISQTKNCGVREFSLKEENITCMLLHSIRTAKEVKKSP